MKTLLVLRFHEWIDLGLLADCIHEAGISTYTIALTDSLTQPSIPLHDGIIVLGGQASAYDIDRHPSLQTADAALRKYLQLNRPVLGVCLGGQLLAQTLGAQVRKNRVPEIGWKKIDFSPCCQADPHLAFTPSTEVLCQWHGDTFDIPPTAQKLASSSDCENQLFRHGDRSYGFQFHLEVNPPLLERWLAADDADEKLHSVGMNQNTIRQECELYAKNQIKWTRAFMSHFLKCV